MSINIQGKSVHSVLCIDLLSIKRIESAPIGCGHSLSIYMDEGRSYTFVLQKEDAGNVFTQWAKHIGSSDPYMVMFQYVEEGSNKAEIIFES